MTSIAAVAGIIHFARAVDTNQGVGSNGKTGLDATSPSSLNKPSGNDISVDQRSESDVSDNDSPDASSSPSPSPSSPPAPVNFRCDFELEVSDGVLRCNASGSALTSDDAPPPVGRFVVDCTDGFALSDGAATNQSITSSLSIYGTQSAQAAQLDAEISTSSSESSASLTLYNDGTTSELSGTCRFSY